eukprot:301437-Rhodomonas_salina.1
MAAPLLFLLAPLLFLLALLLFLQATVLYMLRMLGWMLRGARLTRRAALFGGSQPCLHETQLFASVFSTRGCAFQG